MSINLTSNWAQYRPPLSFNPVSQLAPPIVYACCYLCIQSSQCVLMMIHTHHVFILAPALELHHSPHAVKFRLERCILHPEPKPNVTHHNSSHIDIGFRNLSPIYTPPLSTWFSPRQTYTHIIYYQREGGCSLGWVNSPRNERTTAVRVLMSKGRPVYLSLKCDYRHFNPCSMSKSRGLCTLNYDKPLNLLLLINSPLCSVTVYLTPTSPHVALLTLYPIPTTTYMLTLVRPVASLPICRLFKSVYRSECAAVYGCCGGNALGWGMRAVRAPSYAAGVNITLAAAAATTEPILGTGDIKLTASAVPHKSNKDLFIDSKDTNLLFLKLTS